MKVKGIIALLMVLSFFSCDKTITNESKTFDDAKMLKTAYQDFIQPNEEEFCRNALALQNSVKAFSQDVNETNLKEARSQWLLVAKSWARCFSFNIGSVRKEDYFRYLATFPISETGIDNRIKDTSIEKLTPRFVLSSFGLSSKGIFGVEYLLYRDDLEKTVEVYQNDAKRLKFLGLLVNELVSDITRSKEDWEKYSIPFLENKVGLDSHNNSINQLFGGLDNVIHFLWETKLGKGIRKKDIEAPYSKQTLELIRENIKMTKEVYLAIFAEKVRFSMNGSDDLNKDVEKRYELIDKALNNIKEPLITAVVSDVEAVEALIEQLKALELREFSKVETVLNLIDGPKEGDGD